MNCRNILFAVIVWCVFWTSCTIAFGQWPGEGPLDGSATDAEGWPTIGQTPTGNYVPANAENFICTVKRLKPAEALSRLEKADSGRRKCPSDSSNYGSYFLGDRQEALEKLIQVAGVRKSRIIAIEQHNFDNAAAVLCEAYDGEVKQLVMWDPQFLEELDAQAGTKWASVAILAHELAHHLNNDTGQNPDVIPLHERREQELYADRYAGQKLQEFGVSKNDAVEVFYHLGEGGETHPPPHQRVASAGEGWDAGRAQTVETYPPPDDREYPPPPPPPPPTTTSSSPTSPTYGNALCHFYRPLLYVAPGVGPTNPGRLRLSLRLGGCRYCPVILRRPRRCIWQ